MGSSSNKSISVNLSDIYKGIIDFKDKVQTLKKGKIEGYFITHKSFKTISSSLGLDNDDNFESNKKNIDDIIRDIGIRIIKSNDIKIIKSVEEFEDYDKFYLEIVEEKVIKNFKYCKNNNIIYNVLSKDKHQIIFKDNSKIKITKIDGNKKYNIIPPQVNQDKTNSPESKKEQK